MRNSDKMLHINVSPITTGRRGDGDLFGESPGFLAENGRRQRRSRRWRGKTSRMASCAYTARGASPPTTTRSSSARTARKRRFGNSRPAAARPSSLARHRVSELLEWNDFDLEQQGRLTHPMRYDADCRPLCSVRLGGRVRGDRRRVESARPEVRHLLRVRPRKPGDGVSLCPVRSDVRHEQPARQLQHVPRDDIGRAQGHDRGRGGHGRVRRPRQLRRHVLLRTEHGVQQCRGFSTRSRTPPSAAFRSSCSIPCGRKGSNSSSTRRTPSKC